MSPAAIIALNQTSANLGRRIQAILPNATLYGLTDRTTTVDITFENFGDTLRELFAQGTPIIGICAAGILIRTLAPALTNKWQEPPVIAIAEDGSAVVPLLGGLQGVNDLARQIAAGFEVQAAITTTGDIRFRTALLSPPSGYVLANPEDAKTFIADLLAGKSVQLQGHAPWITASQLPLQDSATHTLQVSERIGEPSPTCLVYHPKTLAIGLASSSVSGDRIQMLLTEAGLATQSLAGLFVLQSEAGQPEIQAIAQHFQIPIRFFKATDLESPESTAALLALTAAGPEGRLLIDQTDWAIAVADTPIEVEQIGRAPGKLVIIGTGPGGPNWISPEVKAALQKTTDWVGYKTYLDLAEPWRTQQNRHESDNREELDRARAALDLAATGRSVAVISSGDPGIFAMAAAVFEVIDRDNNPNWSIIEIQVCPGISAMQAAAAQVGAPLGHDFCAISLSDLLKPWTVIEQRIAAAAQADFAIAFYNPISKQRRWQLEKAKDVLLQHRSPQTPVVLARNLGRSGQTVTVTTLKDLEPESADMRTVILIGSSQTRVIQRSNSQPWVYTPRHYD